MTRKTAAIRFTVTECSLGALLIAESDKGICAIAFHDNPELLIQDLKQSSPDATITSANSKSSAEFMQRVAEIVRFVETPKTAPDLPLDLQGTDFQKQVWKAISEIPSGTTATYTDIAAKIGKPDAVRAVAGACAANNLAMVIPCHRVVRRDGGLSGYRWGVERKRALLAKEAQLL